FPGAWSPDGTKLLAVDLRNNSDFSVSLVDLDAGESRELTPHEDDAIFFPGAWAPDGSGFYLVTDDGSEFRGLAFYDLGSDRYDWVEEQTHDVEDVKVFADGRELTALEDGDGNDRMTLHDLVRG